MVVILQVSKFRIFLFFLLYLGASGDVLVITGTKFSATPGDNSVLVGDVPCGVTASTTTSITCTLGK